MNILAMGFGSPTEIAIIAGIVLIFFGGARIAGFGKSMGEGIRGFKNQLNTPDENASEPPEAPDGAGKRNSEQGNQS